ncbi:MAG: hypothetical protein U1U88_000957 [Lawsonella clevelandensis]
MSEDTTEPTTEPTGPTSTSGPITAADQRNGTNWADRTNWASHRPRQPTCHRHDRHDRRRPLQPGRRR